MEFSAAGVQWVAYSGNGLVEGNVVYCHYGRKKDFELLQEIGINITVNFLIPFDVVYTSIF